MTTSDDRLLLLTPSEAAGVLGRTVAELRLWRSQGVGPIFYTLGTRTIRYSARSVRAFAHTDPDA